MTLDEVLAITYASAHTWAPDGGIGFIHDDGARFSLRIVDAHAGDVVSLDVATGRE